MRMTHRCTRWLAYLCVCVLATPQPSSAQGAATHSSNVWRVTFSRNDSSVATVARGEVRIWALPSGTLACRLDGAFDGARVATDGESGFHVTLLSIDGNWQRATRAFRVDPVTCRQTPAPLIDGLKGGYAPIKYVVRLPDGRDLPNEFATARDSRLAINSLGKGWVVETPSGVRLESENAATALEVGSVVYACTATPRKVTYHRVTAEGRVDRIGESNADSYSGCGALSLSVDSTVLLNVGDGAAVDLRRKRVLVSHSMPQATSVGIDADQRRLAVGHATGVVVVDVGSRRLVQQLSDGLTPGTVSPTGEWMAIAGGVVSRPLVRLEGRSHPNIVLDDARSRQAADILVAREEGERRARAEAARQAQVRDDEASARGRANATARLDLLRQNVESRIGKVLMFATLRQIQYQGPYDWVRVDVKQGDVLVLASEGDGVVGYSITDGTRTERGDRRAGDVREGFMMVRSTMISDISGNLLVQGRGAPVHVFLIRKADAR
jgi:hypothetical protein